MSKVKVGKKNTKFIALSQGIEYLPHRNEYRNFVDQNIVDFIESCNFKTILINNFLKKKKYN